MKLFEELEKITEQLELIVEEEENKTAEQKKAEEAEAEKEDKEAEANEPRVIKPVEKTAVDRVDLEKRLKSTDDKKADFKRDFVDAVNNVITGEGTLEEVIRVVKEQ